MLSTIRRLAAAALILMVGPGAAAFGDEFEKYGDCSDFGALDLGEFARPLSCDASGSFECALTLALAAANGIERCDRKITALTYIGGELSKARNIHGEGIEEIGRNILAQAMNGLERIPDAGARHGPAWSIGHSLMNAGYYDEAREFSEHLPAYLQSMILSWGASQAALRCDEKYVTPLLEAAKEFADSLPASAGKVRAYTWISWVYHLTNSKKSLEILDLAGTNLEEISWWDDATSLGKASVWGKVYYTIGLFAADRIFEARRNLNEIEDPYQSAYVLSFSALFLSVSGNDEMARRLVVRADGLLMDHRLI